MSPKERTVVRAVANALTGGDCDDMDALASSYPLPSGYTSRRRAERAGMLLRVLIGDAPIEDRK